MGLIIGVLILAILLGFGGLAIHVLWYLAVIVFLVWLVGFLVRVGTGRWYRW